MMVLKLFQLSNPLTAGAEYPRRILAQQHVSLSRDDEKDHDGSLVKKDDDDHIYSLSK
jgi:hypothetical protein